MEALGFIAFDLARISVDSITGLSPFISVDQHLTNRNPRSTVGTVTDVYTYLRVLFTRLGHRPAQACLQLRPATERLPACFLRLPVLPAEQPIGCLEWLYEII